MNVRTSLINPEIILTDRIPLGSGEYMTPEYGLAIKSAGAYPWFWDMKKSQILLSPHFLHLIPDAVREDLHLYPFIHSVLSRKDVRRFFHILKSFIRLNGTDESDFQMKQRDGRSLWMRVSGNYIKEDGRITGALGHIRNISESVRLEHTLEENRDFLNTLINLIPLPIYYKNETGHYQFFNKAFEEIQKLPADEIIGKSVFDLYGKEEAEIFDQNDREVMDRKEIHVYEHPVTFSDGIVRDILIHKAVDVSPVDNRVKGLAGFMLDMTDQKRSEQRIKRLMDIKELVVEINHAILSIPDLQSLLEFILKKIPQVVKGADCGTILLNDNDILTVTASYGYMGGMGFSFPITGSFMYKKGQGLPDEVVIINNIQDVLRKGDFPPLLPTISGKTIESFMGSPIIHNGRTLGLFSLDSFTNNVFTEEDVEVMDYLNEQLAVILDKQTLYQKVLGLSRFDSLTGLGNRHYFQEQAQAALNRAERNGESLIIFLADLDSLKPVNDFWGHEAGDAMISCFSSLLKKSFRDSDILGRLGGDEFTGIFYDTMKDDLEARFNDFRMTPPRFEVADGTVPCRFSFGTAEFPRDSESLEELINLADKRMYSMKKKSKQDRGPVTRQSLLNA